MIGLAVRRLFGPSVNIFAAVATAGLALAVLIAALPVVLIVATAVTEVGKVGLSELVSRALDSRNLLALSNSIIVGGVVAIVVTTMAIMLGLALHQIGLTGDPVIYMLAAIPVMIPDYVFGVVAYALIEPQFGMLRSIVPTGFLISREGALAAIAAATLFKWLPILVVVVDVQISAVPLHVKRQAALDFRSRRDLIRTVLLPRIAQILPLLSIFSFLVGFRQYELAKELTASGAGFRAEMWTSWNYRNIYEFFDYGSAAAGSLLTLAILLPLVELFRRLISSDSRGAP
jgi:ABC-type sugar transport system permease subunit